jgi:hypothetical protein
VEEMKRMREKWKKRRCEWKNCGKRDEEGTELSCSMDKKEILGKEDIGNVIFTEYRLIPYGERNQWVRSENIVDLIESAILEREKKKEDLREKDCVNWDSLLCNILTLLIRFYFISVESVVCLSRRMLLQQICLLCSDPHSSFSRKECFEMIGWLVQWGTTGPMKLMHSMGLLKCVEARMSEKKERN